MNIHIKNLGAGKAEAFLEVWDNQLNDLRTACVARLLIVGDKCLIDTIDTGPTFRRKGYASALVKELQNRFNKVAPIGIENTVEAQGFWEKLGMEDALGHEE